jgi:hypothetical protein
MILFVTKNSDTFNNPTLYSVFNILDKNKTSFILLCKNNKFRSPFEFINIIYHNHIHSYSKYKIINLLYYFKNNMELFLKLLAYKGKIKLIVGIDPDGIIWAKEIKSRFFRKTPLDYFSFEIFFKDEGVNKWEEIDACTNIRFLLIQDKYREATIRDENKISPAVKSFYIPVSPIFNKKHCCQKIYNIRELYNIPKEKKMIVQFGSLDFWSGSEFIRDMLINNLLPKEYVFVIHTRYPLNKENPIHRCLLNYSIDNNNLVISDSYIENYDDALSFLKQFDFATAFYFPGSDYYTGKNIERIGLSSGKFSMYMKAGLPTFTTNLSTYEGLKKKYNFGYVVKDLVDFKLKLQDAINCDVNSFDCLKLYEELLDPEYSINQYLEHAYLR